MIFGKRNNDRNDRSAKSRDSDVAVRNESETLLLQLVQANYLFRLFVSGTSARSTRAITNVRDICNQYLAGHYELEVFDVYQQPAATRQSQVIAVPTLIKEQPFPPRRFVGDMSNTERIVTGLNLRR